jgi:hypothetical protein
MSIIIMMTPNSNDCDSPIGRRNDTPEAAVHPEEEENRVCSATTLPVEVVRDRTVLLPVCLEIYYVDSGNNETMLCVFVIGLKIHPYLPLMRSHGAP